MRILIVIFFCFFIHDYTFSQKNKAHKFVPYFASLKVDKLTHHLTKDLTSDEDKIAAIHSWITHNIHYDVKQWIDYNSTPTPLRKILIRRKAVCTGYSSLFQEMCKYAQVQSIIVNGYTKNEFTDLKDKFYLDEHAWNAVYVNNNWKLVDACWDAGYIEYYKRTFTGYFIYAFTFGTSDRLVYKPHFVSKPRLDYYNKNGNYFITDHFPANPIWQLINAPVSVEQAENDSSYYLKRYDNSTNYILADHLDGERSNYLSLSETDRSISEGFSAFQYNPKNNARIANSYFLMASNVYERVTPEMTEKSMLIQRCDSILTLTDKATLHTDSNAVMLLRQKNELVQNNLKKKGICSEENKRLISSTEKVVKIFNSGIKIGLSGGILLKTMIQRNKIQIHKIKKNDAFESTNYGKKVNTADSAEIAGTIKSLKNDQRKADSTLNNKLKELGKLYNRYNTNMEEHLKRSEQNAKTTQKICDQRLQFADDLDKRLREVKDSLLSHKFKDDSLLIDGENGPIVAHFNKEFNSLKEDFSNFYSSTQELISEYAKFKKANKSKSDFTPQYTECVELYKNHMKTYMEEIRTYKKKFKHIYKTSKAHIEPIQAEHHAYLKEQFIEFQIFTTRGSFINRHYKVRIAENKLLKSKSVKLHRKVEKIKMKIK